MDNCGCGIRLTCSRAQKWLKTQSVTDSAQSNDWKTSHGDINSDPTVDCDTFIWLIE